MEWLGRSNPVRPGRWHRDSQPHTADRAAQPGRGRWKSGWGPGV